MCPMSSLDYYHTTYRPLNLNIIIFFILYYD